MRSRATVQSPAGFANVNLRRAGLRSRLEDAGYLYSIAPWETAAGMVSADLTYGYLPGNAFRYGCVGDGVTDDTAGLRNACLAIQELGAGVLDLADGEFAVYVGDNVSTVESDPIAEFDGLRGFRLASRGARIIVDREYTGATFGNLFLFSDCDRVHLESVDIVGTDEQPEFERADRGLFAFFFQQGCEGVTFDTITGINLRGVVSFRREANESTALKCKDIRGRVRAVKCGYPLSGALSGDNMNVEVISEQCTRSFYIYGCQNVDATVRSRNHEGSADVLISTAVGNGNDDIRVKYINRDSTVNDNSRNCVVIEYGDEDAATCSRINIDLSIRTVGGAAFGYGFKIGKLDDDENPDTVDRGHILDGLRLTGAIIGSHANQRTVAFCGVGTWAAGETVRDVRVSLRHGAPGQPIYNLGSLDDCIHFDNCQFDVTPDLDPPAAGAGTANVVFTACAAPNFTTSTADTIQMSYVGCRITDGTNQARVNKAFIGCRFVGVNGVFTAVAPAGHLGVPQFATAGLPAAGATLNGLVIIEDTGGAGRNFVVYDGASRFRFTGGTAF